MSEKREIRKYEGTKLVPNAGKLQVAIITYRQIQKMKECKDYLKGTDFQNKTKQIEGFWPIWISYHFLQIVWPIIWKVHQSFGENNGKVKLIMLKWRIQLNLLILEYDPKDFKKCMKLW